MGCAGCFVFGRPLVWTLQGTQRRMVGQRAIQLRLVRSLFRFVSLLAPLAGPAANRNWKSASTDAKQRPGFHIPNPKGTNDRWIARHCCAARVTASPPF